VGVGVGDSVCAHTVHQGALVKREVRYGGNDEYGIVLSVDLKTKLVRVLYMDGRECDQDPSVHVLKYV